MKFSKIIEPESGGYTNNTESWILILGISYLPTVSPDGPGLYEDGVGVVRDLQDNIVDQMGFVQFQDYLYTSGSSSYSFSHSVGFMKPFILVPPGYNIENFGYAIAFFMDYDEVEEFIMNHKEILGSSKVMSP
ncbi:MAG: hypothetical protein QXH07_07185 [Thermoplasmata archaeon]